MRETNTKEAQHWFWVLLDVLIAALILGFMGVVLPLAVQWSSSFTPAKTVTVTAEGKTTAVPDIAEVTFSVVSQGADVQTITNDGTSKMNAVLSFVVSQGIASSDVQTTGYDLEPNYTYNKGANTQNITGYTLTQTATVKVRNLTNVSNVIAGLAPLGVNQIGGVNFTFDNTNSYLSIARADALNQAHVKALQMAQAAGAALGSVVSVSENSGIPGPRPIYGMATASVGEASPVAPTVNPGSEDITDDVTVTYALR